MSPTFICLSRKIFVGDKVGPICRRQNPLVLTANNALFTLTDLLADKLVSTVAAFSVPARSCRPTFFRVGRQNFFSGQFVGRYKKTPV